MNVPFKDIKPFLLDAFLRGVALRMTVTGASMHPWIKGGQVVELEGVDPAVVRVGDVVLVERPDETCVLHRVVGLDHDDILLRGDAQRGCEKLGRNAVVARLACVHRGRRVLHLNRGIWRHLGFLWVLFYPLGNLLYDSVSVVRRRSRHLLARL